MRVVNPHIHTHTYTFYWGNRDVYWPLSDDDVISGKLVIQQEKRVSHVFIPDVWSLVPERLFKI